jgi:hypothetical protein
MKIRFFTVFTTCLLFFNVSFAQQSKCYEQKKEVFNYFPKEALVALQSTLNGTYHMGANRPVATKLLSGSVLGECSPYANGESYNVIIDFSIQAMDDDTHALSGSPFQMKSCLLSFKAEENVSSDGKKWMKATISGPIDCRISEFQLLLEQENAIF